MAPDSYDAKSDERLANRVFQGDGMTLAERWRAQYLIREAISMRIGGPSVPSCDEIIEECAKEAISHIYTGVPRSWQDYAPYKESKVLGVGDLAYAWSTGRGDMAEDIFNRICALKRIPATPERK